MFRSMLPLAAAAMLASTAMPAHALKFVFNDTGGVTGTVAAGGFAAAGRFWESIITNDVTVRFNVGFRDLGPNVLGSTGSTLTTRSIQGVTNRIRAFGSNSGVDVAVRSTTGLPGLTPGQLGVGALTVVTPGYVDPVNQLGIDNSYGVVDSDGSFNNSVIALSTANAKALGYGIDPRQADANITFSSAFPFDFDARDGITAGQYDFLGVAIHEIGHALGFISGADDYDFLGCPSGPGCAALSDYAVNNDWWGYTLDLFRYSAPGTLNWRPGVDAYFSIDGGANALYGNGNLAQGSYHGAAGDQASHWLAPTQSPFCSGLTGLMNPYLCGGRQGIVTSTDLGAFDAIGWNLVDGVRGKGIALDTGQIATAVGVPEASTWAMLIAGFGLVGFTARRRRPVATGA
jgi:hypothetical protein